MNPDRTAQINRRTQSVEQWSSLISGFISYIPALIVGFIAILLLSLANWLLLKRQEKMGSEAKVPRQMLMLLFTVVACLIVLLIIPMTDATRGQVLSLLGIVITAVIAMSSTTFVANAMAGVMLRMVKSFRHGDFIRIGDQFGRVTERGLFHTEIQTEDRDLTTLPNLHLVTNPITVVHSSGTMITATLSLGYDVPHTLVEECLKKAAEDTELQESFVLIKELNDYSVTYKVAGFLPEVKHLLTTQSNLRKKVLDVLHNRGIEIVSPAFMNQRQLPQDKKIIPAEIQKTSKKPEEEIETSAEAIIFDKAEEVAELESLQNDYNNLVQKLKDLNKQKKPIDEKELAAFETEITETEQKIAKLISVLEEKQSAQESKSEGNPS
jgi:small conductance mechanosensitive channel